MKTPLHCFAVAVVCFAAFSGDAAPPDESENVTQVKLGDVAWEIHYAFKKEDGTLVQAKGRKTSAVDGLLSLGAFTAGKCKLEADRLVLSEGFVLTGRNSEITNAEPNTRVILSSTRLDIVDGRAKTRIVQDRPKK